MADPGPGLSWLGGLCRDLGRRSRCARPGGGGRQGRPAPLTCTGTENGALVAAQHPGAFCGARTGCGGGPGGCGAAPSAAVAVKAVNGPVAPSSAHLRLKPAGVRRVRLAGHPPAAFAGPRVVARGDAAGRSARGLGARAARWGVLQGAETVFPERVEETLKQAGRQSGLPSPS